MQPLLVDQLEHLIVMEELIFLLSKIAPQNSVYLV
jgi:hypothetical protein